LVDSSNKLTSLFGKLYSGSIGENESKDEIEQMITEIAMTNCKRLNEANKLSFKGLLSVLESEYCVKHQIVKNAVANRKWQQIFETEKHFFHFVRNFLSDLTGPKSRWDRCSPR
jgi:hypothetical protein